MDQTIKQRHILGIDIVRFFSAISVAVFHLNWRSAATTGYALWGWVGVEVFFVISGIVISASAELTDFRNFLRGRFLRLYPGAWVCGAIIVVTLLSFRPNLFWALGIDSFFSFKGVAGSAILFAPWRLSSAYWTLPVEIAFYGFIGVFLLFGFREKLVWAARLLVLLSIPYYFALIIDFLGYARLPWVDLGYGLKNTILVRHGVYFALGMYIHFFFGRLRRQLTSYDSVLFTTALSLAVFGIVWRAHDVAPLYVLQFGVPAIDPKALAIAAALVFALCLSVLALSIAFNDNFHLSERTRKVIRSIGLATYPVYLLHEGLGGTVLFFAFRYKLGSNFGLLAAILCVIAASLIAVVWEQRVREFLSAPVGLLHSLVSVKASIEKPSDRRPASSLRVSS
jgi:exopolysaccharide production protein ExoZ